MSDQPQDQPNFFEAHAEALRPQRGSAERRAERAAQAKGEREASPLARKRKEKAELSRRWRKTRREEWRSIISSSQGAALVEFRRTLKRFDDAQPNAGQAFVALVHEHEWLRHLPKVAKAVARGLVTQAVIRIRAKAGFEFIDDALPGEAPTALERCHAFIGRP